MRHILLLLLRGAFGAQEALDPVDYFWLLQKCGQTFHIRLQIDALLLPERWSLGHEDVFVEEVLVEGPDEQENLQPQYTIRIPLAPAANRAAAAHLQIIVVVLRLLDAWAAEEVGENVLLIQMQRPAPILSVRVQELHDHDGLLNIRAPGIDKPPYNEPQRLVLRSPLHELLDAFLAEQIYGNLKGPQASPIQSAAPIRRLTECIGLVARGHPLDDLRQARLDALGSLASAIELGILSNRFHYLKTR